MRIQTLHELGLGYRRIVSKFCSVGSSFYCCTLYISSSVDLWPSDSDTWLAWMHSILFTARPHCSCRNADRCNSQSDSVRLSVCLSVRHVPVCFVQTNEDTIVRL